MHILDFVLYFPLLMLVWKIIDKTSDGELTKELGILWGVILCLLFTILYIFLFAVYPDWNWIDIFNPLKNFVFPDVNW